MVRVSVANDRGGCAAAPVSAPHRMDDSPPAQRSQPASARPRKHAAPIEQPPGSKDSAAESNSPQSCRSELTTRCRNGEYHSCDSISAPHQCDPHAPPPRPRRSAGSAAATAAGSGSGARLDCSCREQTAWQLRFTRESSCRTQSRSARLPDPPCGSSHRSPGSPPPLRSSAYDRGQQ